MNKQCAQCHKTFQIESEDLEFYKKIDVPAPKLCAPCREQRRIAWHNERTLYSIECDLCKKKILAIYNSDKKFPVYCPECWWSDKWDPMDYGLEFDFAKPFFPQYMELFNKVPHISLMNRQPQNSDYVNETNRCKDCYLVFDTEHSDSSYYGLNGTRMNNCLDFYDSTDCQYCYELIDCTNCYHSFFCEFCKDVNDCWFCYDCINTQNCLGCAGLRHKNYHIFNVQYSANEYNRRIQSYQLNTTKGLINFKKKFADFLLRYPRRYATAVNSEKCTGDIFVNCANSINSYDATETINVKNIYTGYYLKDSYDASGCGLDSSQLIYEGLFVNYKAYHVLFSINCWYSNNIDYCHYCFNVQDCLACFGLRKGKNCIFNKEYGENEYKILKNKIIQQMKESGEYGEFWPIHFSPFSYNETVANTYFPLSKQEVMANHWNWREPAIKTANDSLSCCQKCHNNYKLIPQEEKFYQDYNLPKPLLCSNCRHLDRIHKKNPRSLWHRQCMKPDCHNTFETTYSPERKELVYCESCYNKEVY